jgi:hypothetical protein
MMLSLLLAYTLASAAPVAPARGKTAPAQTSAVTFDFDPGDYGSGPSLLSSALTVASVSATLMFDCDARKITGATWVCATGGTLTETDEANHAHPTPNRYAPFTEQGARSVKFGGGYEYDAPSTATGDITTNDIIIEVVFYAAYDGAGGDDTILSKRLDSGTFPGWWFGESAANAVQFVVDTGATAVATGNVAVTDGSWNHVLCWYSGNNSSLGIACSVNGAAATGANAQATFGLSATTAAPLRIGGWGAPGGTPGFTGEVSFARGWSLPANTIPNGGAGNVANYALPRALTVAGAWPAVMPSLTSANAARAATATVDIDRDRNGVRNIFYVGNNWMRVAERRDANGTLVMGFLPEKTATNLLIQDDAIDNVAWTKTNGSVSANTTTAPILAATADTFTATSGAGSVVHFLDQTATLTAATYTLSSFVQAGAGVATYAFVRDTTVANAIGWVKLSDCSKGTRGAGVANLYAESYGRGFCRVGISFTGTAAVHSLDVGMSNADNTTTYDDGTNTSKIAVWCPQVENNPLPTACILTAASTVNRSKDDYHVALTSNVNTSGMTAEAVVVMPNMPTTLPVAGVYTPGGYFLSPPGGGPLFLNDASGQCRVVTQNDAGSTQADLTPVGNIFDGTVHKCRAALRVNNFVAWTDLTASGRDTSGTLPSFVGTIQIGENNTSNAQTMGLIVRLRAFSTEVAPP